MNPNDRAARLRLLAFASVAAISQAWSGLAMADPAPAKDANTVEEVVVTATKRSERLNEVPISITALGEKELTRQGSRRLEDVARVTPGLVLQPSPRGDSGIPQIRGISSTAGAATVGIYVDDVPVQSRPSGFASDPTPYLFDVDRVEVLRGPQGTLYGASAMGGAIRYITKGPSYDGVLGQVRAEVASVSRGAMNYELAGSVAAPLAKDSVGTRISAVYRRDGGFVDRRDVITGAVIDKDADTATTFGLNASLGWRVNDRLEVRPGLLYQKITRDDQPVFEVGAPKFSQHNVQPQRDNNHFVLPSLTLNYDFGFAKLTSVTAYLKKSQHQVTDYATLADNLVFGRNSMPGFERFPAPSTADVNGRSITQEMRLASTGNGRLTWLGGLFYRRLNDHFQQFAQDTALDAEFQTFIGITLQQATGVALLPNFGIYRGDTRTIDTELSVFGEATYALTDKLKLTGGARASKTKVDFRRLTQGPLNGGTQFVKGSLEETPINPKIALNYTFSEQALFYVSAQKGFRSGGINPPVPTVRCAADLAALGGTPPSTYTSDSLWSYETGAKVQSADRRLSVNAAAYQIDWSDIQQSVALPRCGFGYTDNFGQARSRGAELEVAARPAEWLSLGARVGYVDAQITKDLLAPENPVTHTRGVIARQGDRLLGIPDLTVALNAELSYPARDDVRLYLRGDYQWLSSYVRTPAKGRIGYDGRIVDGESYDRASLRAGLETTSGWSAALFIDNLTNNDPNLYLSAALSPAVGTLKASTLRPRTVGISVSRRF